MEGKIGSILLSILIAGLVAGIVKLLNWVWFRPKKLENLLRKQGLNGNPYKLLVGDIKELISVVKEEQPKGIKLSDNLAPHIFPYYYQTIRKYGKNAFVWLGPSPKLMIVDPELMKEILLNPDLFQKPRPDPIGQTLAGGLLFLEGQKWAKHRKIVNPAFHMDKLKDGAKHSDFGYPKSGKRSRIPLTEYYGVKFSLTKNMVPTIRLSCAKMLEKWEALFSSSDESLEIDVWPYLENLSGDVISRVAFSSNHEEGRRIFEVQKEQMKLILKLLQFIFIPGWRFLPTRANRRMKAMRKEIELSVRGIIKKREKAMEMGESIDDDLLSTLMKSKENVGMSIEDVIKECKLFYFAGSETTSLLLVWTMVMLSKHQEWQARAREEVLRVFGSNEPTFDNLNRLKIVTMILYEVLRLYPSAPLITRTPTKTTKLGNITLPVGVDLMVLIGLLHLDPEIWGEDVNEFKPERFSDGISSATKNQFSFIPFSNGPRVCIGQNFAMIEAKLALAMILHRFSFELSSSYVHAPFPIITLQPQHGATLLLHKL